MGIRWAPISVERSVPLLNETRGPFMQSTYLSSSFLTSVRSDSLLSHRKSGEQRSWSTLITCTPPRGSSPLIRWLDGPLMCDGEFLRTCPCMCETGKLSYDNRRWANWILTPYIHTVGQPDPSLPTLHPTPHPPTPPLSPSLQLRESPALSF